MDSEKQASEATKNIERIKAIRRGHRGVVTKLTNEAGSYNINDSLSEETLYRLEIIDQQLETKIRVLEDLNQQILNVCSVEEIESEIEDSEAILWKILECRKGIDIIRRKHESLKVQGQMPAVQSQVQITEEQSQTLSQQDATQPQESDQSHEQGTVINNVDNVTPISITSSVTRTRLPKLTLPKFKGNVVNWTTFWDSFQSAIHNNKDITDVDKFNYLNSVLEGSAARAIKGLAISEANYKAAIEILTERFGKPQQLISAHMDELMKLPPCQSERPSSLRFVYDNISVHVRGLASLGVTAEQYGSLLIPIIMSKLPDEIRLLIARKSTKDVWQINELLDIIKAEVDARETSNAVKANESRRFGEASKEQRMRRLPPSAGSFTTGVKTIVPDNIRCVYCNEGHYSASCERITDARARKDILYKEGRCFNCIRKGHQTKDCQSTKTCRLCGSRHHQSICTAQQNNKPTKTEENPKLPPTDQTTKTATARDDTKKTVLLQTASAFALNENKSKSVPVRILFDNGSQRTYVTSKLKSRLGLKPIKMETLRLNTFGQGNFKKEKCSVVKLRLKKHEQEIDVVALEHPVICSPLPTKICVDQRYLEGLDLADTFEDTTGDIDILVGSDYYWEFVTGEIIRGEGPTAVASRLGWLLSGPLDNAKENNDLLVSNLIISGNCNSFEESSHSDPLIDVLKKFWDVETVGVRDETTPSNQGINDIQFEKDRYVVGLPWKQDFNTESTNYELSHNRLRSMHYKLRNQPEILKEYDNIFQSQKEAGIIEEIPIEEEKVQDACDVHYIPHHAVVRQDKETTKVRIVYDCSAKSSSQQNSLNDCLETGPNFIPRLFDVLVQFRSNPVALVADVEKAFHMVGIRKEDRDKLRFLWFKDPESSNPEVVQMRFCRLVFGLKCSPSMLGGTILHHLESYEKLYPDIVDIIKKSLYVDDLASGSTSDEKAFNIYEKSKKIFADGGFNLRKWSSNSKALMERIQEEERVVDHQKQPQQEQRTNSQSGTTEEDETYAKYQVGPHSDKNDDDTVKLLGISWNTTSDEFYYNLSELIHYAKTLPVTKRSLLKLTARIFDPLGLLSPVTIKMKMTFQVLCKEGIDWDEPLHGDTKDQYQDFMVDLQSINHLRVPRCYFARNSTPISIQLNAFCDASEKAMGTAIYLKSTYDNGVVQVRLIASKTKVAPIKRQSIPRQELLGAVILARLVDTVVKALAREIEVIYWTDSMTVLYWIVNHKQWKQYVQHRVQEIRSLTKGGVWRHCPGQFNPADLPSRGITGKDLLENSLWWSGPAFLLQPEDQWPSSPLLNDGKALEELVTQPAPTTFAMTSLHGPKRTAHISDIIDCERFNDLNSLLRVTAYVLRAIKFFQRRVNKGSSRSKGQLELTAKELEEAEACWILSVQDTAFDKERAYLKRKQHSSTPALVPQLGLFIDEDGLLKCRGRIANADVCQSMKTPILLPSKHHLVKLVILDVHAKVKHSGIRDTLSTIRERFWILRGRESIKRILRSCVLCRKLEGQPFKAETSPDLPAERVSEDPPFHHTGMDFAGPLYVRTTTGLQETESGGVKAYVCLFTCQSTRALHLELVSSLDVPSFLQAFRRFISRRGLPSTLLSDNAKNFKSSAKEVIKIMRSDEVKRHMATNRITWNFIVERAPWWGGFWERLVKSVKRCLKKIVGRSSLSFEEMRTVLTEVEAVINARPLTYLYDDEESISYPICPSHLINGRRITTTPNSEHFDVVSTYKTLTRKARHQKNILQMFTKQWRKEYLTGLREQHANVARKKNGPVISVGDVVIVKNDSTARLFWKLGIIEELIPGKDGKVRAAIVKVANADKRPSRLRRVIQHLYPIEVKRDDQKQCEEVSLSDNAKVEKSGRPRRQAAQRGELQRRKNT